MYSGDFYEPLRIWSSVLQKEGWEIPKPSSEAYNVSWCGWGYEFNVTPAQMMGTIPKLKELGIKWATLDDRWFDTYGDWNPRSDTFPGDSIKKMVDDFHKQGILRADLVAAAWLWKMATATVRICTYITAKRCERASGVANSRQERQTCPHDRDLAIL